MVPKEFYDKVNSSPVGKLINRLIEEEYKRGGDTSTPGGYGSIIDQLYYVITKTKPEADTKPTKWDQLSTIKGD